VVNFFDSLTLLHLQLRAMEVRATLEDLMYVSILEKFVGLGVEMLPRLDGKYLLAQTYWLVRWSAAASLQQHPTVLLTDKQVQCACAVATACPCPCLSTMSDVVGGQQLPGHWSVWLLLQVLWTLVLPTLWH
jgi:hypothetical protein